MLPEWLVREVGFRSRRHEVYQGAKVAWYYHEQQNKAVLANHTIQKSSMELVGTSALSGVSNDDLESGDVDSARVTIISDLPVSLYERLIRDRIVLKPFYSTENSRLNATCVSIYPEQEYDAGELPNVTHNRISDIDDESNTDVVGQSDDFNDYY